MKEYKDWICRYYSEHEDDEEDGVIIQELIRCKNCEDCMKTKLFDGTRWNYCERLRCVVKDDDFCCWAELKYPKIKAKETE